MLFWQQEGLLPTNQGARRLALRSVYFRVGPAAVGLRTQKLIDCTPAITCVATRGRGITSVGSLLWVVVEIRRTGSGFRCSVSTIRPTRLGTPFPSLRCSLTPTKTSRPKVQSGVGLPWGRFKRHCPATFTKRERVETTRKGARWVSYLEPAYVAPFVVV